MSTGLDDFFAAMDNLDELGRLVAQCPSGDEIARECIAVMRLLLEKNRAYGDSALKPLRLFSRADPLEQLKVRIDDKLSRLAAPEGDERTAPPTEDVEQDLLGYLVLLRVARRRAVDVKT